MSPDVPFREVRDGDSDRDRDDRDRDRRECRNDIESEKLDRRERDVPVRPWPFRGGRFIWDVRDVRWCDIDRALCISARARAASSARTRIELWSCRDPTETGVVARAMFAEPTRETSVERGWAKEVWPVPPPMGVRDPGGWLRPFLPPWVSRPDRL